MTNKEIFIKALEKAEENGFKLRPEIDRSQHYITFTDQGVHFHSKKDDFPYYNETIFDVIFSHEFAKAFFGAVGSIKANYGWRVQLQTLVLEKDKLKYLEKFL